MGEKYKEQTNVTTETDFCSFFDLQEEGFGFYYWGGWHDGTDKTKNMTNSQKRGVWDKETHKWKDTN